MKRQTRQSIIVINRASGNWRYAAEEEEINYKRDSYQSKSEWVCKVTEKPFAIRICYANKAETAEEIRMWARNEAVFMQTVHEMKKDVWPYINMFGKIKKIKKI